MASRVSVIIAAYNVENYVARAVSSVLAQSLPAFEILIVDDGSTDRTRRVVERLAASDRRIRLLHHDSNEGPAAARNHAIKAAQGDWVAVLDADDKWRPSRLEQLLAAAHAQGAVAVADNYICFDESTGQEVAEAFLEKRPVSPITALRFVRSERPSGRVRFGLLKPLISRAFLVERKLEYSNRIRYAEDFHFFMQLLLEGGRAVLVNEPYYIYTLPQSLASGSRSHGSRTHANLTDRIWIADDLLQRYRDRVSPETARALVRYRAWMEDICSGCDAVDLWRSRQPLRALSLGLRRPRGVFSYAMTTPTMKRLRSRLRTVARAPA